MRHSRILTSANWKYALGEVSLIVIGVTLALMATSWYESSQERKDELEALQQVRVALESDLELFSKNFQRLQETEEDVSELLQFLRSGAAYDTRIDPWFSAVTVWRGVRMRLAPYEQIKSRGFSLISNSSIRMKLIDLYESHFGYLEVSTENDQVVTRDQILPYFYARFRRPDDEEWEPIDYAALNSDPLFENLLIAKQNRLQSFVLPAYERAIDAIREVLVEIEGELGPADSRPE